MRLNQKGGSTNAQRLARRHLGRVRMLTCGEACYFVRGPQAVTVQWLCSGASSNYLVLESFATAIRRRYALSSVYGQRRSVRLELNHLDIDVVPAIPDAS